MKPIANNGDRLISNIVTDLTHCTYFYRHNGKKSLLKATRNSKPVLAFALDETAKKVDFYVSVPKNITCEHYNEGSKTHSVVSDSSTHLTYHGTSVNKKNSRQKGEIHIKHNTERVHKEKANLIEAPLCVSSDISRYPLPICRIELDENVCELEKQGSDNFVELEVNGVFFNTIEIYLARRGFMKRLLSEPWRFPPNLPAYFAYTSLEGIYKNNTVIRRRGRYPQILVMESKNFEVVVIAMQEAQNQQYQETKLKYARSINYLEEHFQREVINTNTGFFISKDRCPNIRELSVVGNGV